MTFGRVFLLSARPFWPWTLDCDSGLSGSFVSSQIAPSSVKAASYAATLWSRGGTSDCSVSGAVSVSAAGAVSRAEAVFGDATVSGAATWTISARLEHELRGTQRTMDRNASIDIHPRFVPDQQGSIGFVSSVTNLVVRRPMRTDPATYAANHGPCPTAACSGCAATVAHFVSLVFPGAFETVGCSP
jgi:hypothetical protein